MMAALGLINLIGRWMAARAEASKRAEAAQREIGSANRGTSARPARRVVARAETPRVVERPKRMEPAKVEQRQSEAPNTRPEVAAVPERRTPVQPAAVSVAKPAVVRKHLWTSRSLRQAFIASEILASPVGSRV